jgi:O-6-methylguanine DNA methyltransferase
MVTIVVGNDGKPGELETLMPSLGRGMVKHAWCELGRCALSLLHFPQSSPMCICIMRWTYGLRMLEAQFAAVRKLFGAPVIPGSNEHLELLQVELASYFAGSSRSFSVPLTYPGTPFQRRVWEQLLAIPYGETRSYQGLAVAVGEPKAVRAVGRANGLNRISILIPCHRVVSKDGELGGYGGGLRRKQYLLDLERSGDGGAGLTRRCT